MSGSAREPKYYGDRLDYEPLERKWAGYHARHCGCGRGWLEAHAVPAGRVRGDPPGQGGYYGLVGPGLTEGGSSAPRRLDSIVTAPATALCGSCCSSRVRRVLLISSRPASAQGSFTTARRRSAGVCPAVQFSADRPVQRPSRFP
ncbi:hypothetical protein [Streptomyces sp. NPDC002746]